MKKRISIFSISLILGVTFFYSCRKSTDSNTLSSNASLFNFWSHPYASSNIRLNLRSDKTYMVSIDTFTYEVGTYAYVNSDLTFTSTTPNCSGKTGVYNYSIKGTVLNLTLKSDSCSMRIPYFSGTWNKQ